MQSYFDGKIKLQSEGERDKSDELQNFTFFQLQQNFNQDKSNSKWSASKIEEENQVQPTNYI